MTWSMLGIHMTAGLCTLPWSHHDHSQRSAGQKCLLHSQAFETNTRLHWTPLSIKCDDGSGDFRPLIGVVDGEWATSHAKQDPPLCETNARAVIVAAHGTTLAPATKISLDVAIDAIMLLCPEWDPYSADVQYAPDYHGGWALQDSTTLVRLQEKYNL